MATVSQDAIEQIEARMSELEDELQSYVEELAEVIQERDALKAEVLRLRSVPDSI